MTPARKIKVVPAPLLWLLAGAAGLAAFALVPRDAELVNRMLADGKQQRALEIAEQAGALEEAQRIEQELAAAKPAPAPVEIEPAPPADPSKFLALTMSTLPAGPLAGPHVDTFASALQIAPWGDGADFAHLSSRSDDLSPADAERLYRLVARKALANSDPVRAAEIYDALRRRGTDLSPATIESMVMTYRYAGQPLIALQVLEATLDVTAGSAALSEDERATLVQLYFESSQPGRAFQLLKAEIAETQDPERLAKIIPQAIQAASYSGNGAELAPLLEQFLGNMPYHSMRFPELVAAGREDPSLAGGDYVRFAKQFGQLCEWSARYDEGFDAFSKAAALGDQGALAHCIAVHDGLFRHEDLCDLMHALAPFEGELASERTRLLANLLGRSGDYEAGEAVYDEYLAMNPGDVGALVELAGLRAEAGQLQPALAAYQTALAERPDSVDLITRAAELHVALGQYTEAFALLRDIPDDQHTEATLERFLMLAESLSELDELNRGQIIAFGRKAEHSAEDYLDLAESYALKGDLANEVTVLRGGVAALPGSTKLVLTLADSLYRDAEFAEAAELLTREDLAENTRALALFIEICGGTDRFLYAASHLPEGVEHRHHFSPSIRIELGQIYEEAGNFSAADALYASVPEGREAWQLLATAKYRQGDFDRAEEYQQKYLRAALEPDAQDWMFMGDIYTSQGKTRLADEAYRRSLRILKSGL